MIDRNGRVTSWNAGAERIKGYSAEEIIGRHFSEFYTPEDRAAGLPSFALTTAAKAGKFEGEGWRVRKDGSKFWASVLIDAIREDGELVGFAKITRDMTERQAMQEQLHQSQKMEAIGQLTGGVAHDFNNLLTVILGNLDTLSQQVPPEQARWRRAIDQAMRASERAANLTQQLLAFARRQPLKPKAVEINHLLSRWTELVRRTLPEAISIRRLEDPEAGSAEVDQNQLENALLNLAVNARDAMPNGGTLTVETARALIQAHDVNVPFDLKAGRLFRHLRQRYRHWHVAGSPGARFRAVLHDQAAGTGHRAGTQPGVRLREAIGWQRQDVQPSRARDDDQDLPASHERAGAGSGRRPTHGDACGQRSESILVVEDNEDVRTFSADALRDYGFNVLEAADAAEALRILEGKTRIDLLFTDIGLPGLTGRELVSTVQRKYPSIRVLFTSGYAQMPSPTSSRWMSDIPLLSKPFTRSQLYDRVTQVLAAG